MNKILIIEDEEAIAELEKDYLELSGFDVDLEMDGESGLEKALSNDYDLYILDVMLPGIDGFEICQEIRKEKNAPILMVSARKEDIDKIRGLGLGADDYITKPFSPGELVARVKAHLSRYDRIVESLMPDNTIIKIRGLKIDTTSKEVWVNGEAKSLTAREYDLLEFFMKHPNQVYSKEDIFRELWNMDAIGDIATVTVHVKKLREKIEVDPSKPQYVETVWGMGYRFKV
ncbi:MAG: response regulator transcription factor [Lachnospiraceae bacterium]|nr:response regulator transcription factor [Lachnospiraceae bacterium]